MESSRGTVYEILGSYIDSLCTSIYVGRARGSAVLYHDGTLWPLTTLKDPLPFLEVFYSNGTLEIAGTWREDENHAFFLRTAISKVELIRDGNLLRLIVYPHGKMKGIRGMIILTLQAGRGMGETFEKILREERCSPERENEGEIASSLTSPFISL